MSWAIFDIAGFAFGMYVIRRRFDLIGKGRILSEPLRRVLRWPATAEARVYVRLVQVIALGSALLIDAADVRHMVIGTCWFALYGDDLVTGDDDRWKRWRKGATNAVKWLMQLPSPARAPETA